MLPRSVVALCVALFAVPLFAGCLGGDEAKPVDDGTCGKDCAIDGPVAEGLGAIRGKIFDDQFNPVRGANVTLREKSLTTRTDEQGRFAFNNLEAGVYTVFAQNPPTHRANGRQVEVVPGVPVEADLILEILPPPALPFSVEYPPLNGLIGCAVSFMQLQLADRCGEVNTNAKTRFTFDIYPYLTGIAMHMDSQQGLTGKADLRLDWSVPVIGIPGFFGPTPVEMTHEITEETAWPGWDKPSEAMFNVRASNQNANPQIAYEQRIVIYITGFYNGEPIPDGYSARQD